MKKITDKQYEEYRSYVKARIRGELLTIPVLKLICNAYDYDPVAIGEHLLQVIATHDTEHHFS